MGNHANEGVVRDSDERSLLTPTGSIASVQGPPGGVPHIHLSMSINIIKEGRREQGIPRVYTPDP